jgi:hypothetical protein
MSKKLLTQNINSRHSGTTKCGFDGVFIPLFNLSFQPALNID